MRKILYFIGIFAAFIGIADAAVRDENATNRQSQNTNTVQSRTVSTPRASGATPRSTTSTGATNTRSAVISRGVTTPRQSTQSTRAQNSNVISRPANSRGVARDSGRTTVNARTATTSNANVVARAADTNDTTSAMSQTRTGAEYERCKTAYFTCMDQFCELKNDDYRRCSCSDRVYDLTEIRDVMQDASDQLTVFTENLDVVGMTAAQATAMKTASEGENALTSDTSASKQLLQAIMNSIRGEDSSVGGRYSDLNSITLAFDTTNAFGMTDAGQVIATYNGVNLYNAVYPQCRNAVRDDCTDAQLQRAVTAYLMAIEQDCNAVSSAIELKKKEMKSAVRESSALLDLARVENRQKHNSDDIATCIANVESAILSEEVCGAGYHKCLDNGEFIDVSTGSPIAGVENFYELGELLQFADGVEASEQKLAKNITNRPFVQNFEKRVKKFAEPALDKCTEQADTVWSEYLDKAMLDIYYAQQSKVREIKQGCFDFITACYTNSESGLTAAMADLVGEYTTVLQPDKIALTQEMCTDYVNSCNLMFKNETGNDIIVDYVNNRKDEDVLTACRAVVKQCFDNFGGTNYENFYYPYSGLFQSGTALDWFTLYDYDKNGNKVILSKCAEQLTSIETCNTDEIITKAFGGFDRINANRSGESDFVVASNGAQQVYGTFASTANSTPIDHRIPRATGVATEIYSQIIDSLTTQCNNLQGRFVEYQIIKYDAYDETNFCKSTFTDSLEYKTLSAYYAVGTGEYMCPRDYDSSVDTQSWGACLCWENGGRRSKWGKSPKCVAAVPVTSAANDAMCSSAYSSPDAITSSQPSENWCTKAPTTGNQVCPINGYESNGKCATPDDAILDYLPLGVM